MVVVADEVSNPLFEITGQIIVLKQDTVFKGLMPSLYFALGQRVVRVQRQFVLARANPYSVALR